MVEPLGIDALWSRFEAWLSAAAPLIAGKLRPPADDAALAEAETHLGRPLPAELKQLLKIHDGGEGVIGGFDLLSAQSIGEAYRFLREYFSEVHVPQHLRGLLDADRSAGWIPFAYSVGGDYLCVDLAPGPVGTVGQVFGWNHDDDADPPMAPNLTAWLQRIVAFVEAGEIIYHAGREEFLPFSSSAGFAQAFRAEPPARFDALRREIALRGHRSVALRSVESAGPLPESCRIELTQAGTVVHAWDVDALRQNDECATDFIVFIEEPAPWVPIGAGAALRVPQLAPDDILWIALDFDRG